MQDFLKEIESSKATLKIITKTRDESLFIEKWIQHHLNIIGDGKLIIFDHMSTDEHVLSIYKKYKDNIILAKFDGYPNSIHGYFMFKPFYEALAKSTTFFTILDSDEYLYLYDEKTNKAIHDSSILEYLQENDDCDFFAPCWLDDLEGSDDTFSLTTNFPSRFDWGKPIVHTKIFNNLWEKYYEELVVRHTFELPCLQYTKAKTKFFIAHLCNLSIEQRLKVNMNKIVVHHLLQDNTDFEGLFNLSKKSTPNTSLQFYIKEAKKLVEMKRANQTYMPHNAAKERTMSITQDDSITFFDTFSQHAFHSLMNRNYLDLINYDPATIDTVAYPQFEPWIKR